jgi:hypothetical protein
VGFYLADVAADGAPAFYLAVVFAWDSSAHVVSAIPLEPTARVVFVYPTFASPFGQGLAGVNLEEVEHGVLFVGAQLGAREPFFGEFGLAIGHVFAAEDAEAEHLLWGELGLEVGVEVFAGGFGALVGVVFLHLVVDDYLLRAHGWNLPLAGRKGEHPTSNVQLPTSNIERKREGRTRNFECASTVVRLLVVKAWREPRPTGETRRELSALQPKGGRDCLRSGFGVGGEKARELKLTKSKKKILSGCVVS